MIGQVDRWMDVWTQILCQFDLFAPTFQNGNSVQNIILLPRTAKNSYSILSTWLGSSTLPPFYRFASSSLYHPKCKKMNQIQHYRELLSKVFRKSLFETKLSSSFPECLDTWNTNLFSFVPSSSSR